MGLNILDFVICFCIYFKAFYYKYTCQIFVQENFVVIITLNICLYSIKIKNKKTNSVNSFYFRDVSTEEAAIIKQKNYLKGKTNTIIKKETFQKFSKTCFFESKHYTKK
jgi:hypothetical protein